MKKKVLSLALALAMCLGLTVTAFAEESEPPEDNGQKIVVGDQTYDRLLAALLSEEEDEPITVRLESNVQLTGATVVLGTSDYNGMMGDQEITVAPHDITIDLNGYILSGSKGMAIFEVQDGYTLTIVDSSEAKTGKLASEGEAVIVAEGGTYVPIAEPAAPGQTQQPASAQAVPTNDALTCDGVGQTPTVYKINDSNYFKIRDLAAMLNGTEKQFSVGYDGALKSVTATTGESYVRESTDLSGKPAGPEQADISNDTIYVNGQKVEAEVYKIAGNNYFKLRDLGKALDFYVGWAEDRGVYIETDKPYSE